MREWTPIRNILKYGTLAAAVGAGAACDQQPPITEGTVYDKTPFVTTVADYKRDPATGQLKAVEGSMRTSTSWVVYIAQCPTEKLPPSEKIRDECKTNSFEVPEELYLTLHYGNHVNLGRFK